MSEELTIEAPPAEATEIPVPVQVLTPEQQAIQAQREQWAQNNPGESYRGLEGPSLGLEDIARLEAEADNYGFDSFDRGNITESFAAIQTAGAEREAGLKQKYEAEGYTGETFDKLINDKKAAAMEAAKSQLIESALPIPAGAKRREVKKINRQRDKVLSMLNKTPEEFAVVQADWQAYENVLHTNELDNLHAEALKDDKSLKATTERSRLKQETAELDDKYDGSLQYISQLGIDGDGQTAETLKTYKEKLARHQNDEDLVDADRLQTFHDLKWRLGEVLAERSEADGEKFGDEVIKQKTDEAASHLETWLESMAGIEDDPLADITLYKQKERAYQNWDKRRRQAAEYLGPVIILRNVQNFLKPNPEKSKEEPLDAGKTLKKLLDPRKIGQNNGANALRHSEQLSPADINVYKAGIMGQLELALNYSRHQGNIMKAALIFNALAVGAYEDLSGAWSKLPEKEKTKAFRKKMYGKAAVGSLFARRLLSKTTKATEKTSGSIGFYRDESRKDV